MQKMIIDYGMSTAPFFVIARSLMLETPGNSDKSAIQNE